MGAESLGKPVAISGSPNTITSVAVDIQEGFLGAPLLGSLVGMEMLLTDHDGEPHKVLVIGQMANPETTNRWHENPALKNYLKRQGTLPNLTHDADVTTASVMILGAYRNVSSGYEKYRLSVPAGSGLKVHVAERDLVVAIMKNDKRRYGWLGRIFGSKDAPAPVYSGHFGDVENGGNGEAYMGGVFGPTGSGKTVIAASLDLLLARNAEMGILILDPQSEFATNKLAKGSGFAFDFHSMLEAATDGRFDRDRDIASIDSIQLEGADLFAAMLREKKFVDAIGVGSNLWQKAQDNVGEALDQMNSWDAAVDIDKLEHSNSADYLELREAIIDACAGAYAAGSTKRQRKLFEEHWDTDLARKARIRKIWLEVAMLFSPKNPDGSSKQNLETLIEEVMLQGRKFILDLDPNHLALKDDFKLHLMHFVFRRLSAFAHRQYKKLEENANCLIVLDEAGRFIPHTSTEDKRQAMASYITDRVKELRKFRLGFQFITQNVSEIRSDIFRNLHYRIYGQGLNVGGDANNIKEREGEDAFKTYDTLPDPRQSGIYSYMACGALLALGTTGRPMFIEGFSSDQSLMSENGLRTIFEQRVFAYKIADAHATNGKHPAEVDLEVGL